MSFDKAIRQLSVDDLQFILKNLKRSSVLLDYDFKDLTLSSYGFVKETIPNRYTTGSFEQLVFDAFKDRRRHIFHCDVKHIPVNDTMMFICWLQDELEVIRKLEETYLASEPDMDLMAAGINELNQFGSLNTIDTLANGDILKWEEIKKLPYSTVFDKQYKSVIENRIQKALVKIRQPKKGIK